MMRPYAFYGAFLHYCYIIMRYTPKPKNKKVEVAAVTLFATSVLLLVAGSFDFVKGRAIVQAVGIGCLALCAYLMIRKLTSYTYAVTPKEGNEERSPSELTPSELVFTVTKRIGKGSEVMRAKLDLDALKYAETLPADARERREIIKRCGASPLYYYTVTIRGEGLLLVFEREDIDKCAVVIETDYDMTALLKECAARNGKE